MRYLATMVGAVALMSSGSAMAETAAPSPEAMEEQYKREFQGLSLGVGLSLTVDMGSHDRVNSAEVVNGLVRVSEEENTRARIMLESHYFFTPGGKFLNVEERNWGFGPFVAIQGGDDDIIEAAALGMMMGFRRKDEPGSWNIGIGVVYDPKTRTLGDGIRPNQPLPAGETEIRYKTQSQVGAVILTSFSF